METILCSIAGDSRGNPGLGAIGISVTDQLGSMVCEEAKTIGNTTKHFAEYNAVMTALQTVLSVYGEGTKTKQFEMKLESELVKKQLNAEAQITDPGLVPMFIEIHNMRVVSFPHLKFTLITPAENKDANRLVKEALDAIG
jgi:ribonuclease HI